MLNTLLLLAAPGLFIILHPGLGVLLRLCGLFFGSLKLIMMIIIIMTMIIIKIMMSIMIIIIMMMMILPPPLSPPSF